MTDEELKVNTGKNTINFRTMPLAQTEAIKQTLMAALAESKSSQVVFDTLTNIPSEAEQAEAQLILRRLIINDVVRPADEKYLLYALKSRLKSFTETIRNNAKNVGREILQRTYGIDYDGAFRETLAEFIISREPEVQPAEAVKVGQHKSVDAVKVGQHKSADAATQWGSINQLTMALEHGKETIKRISVSLDAEQKRNATLNEKLCSVSQAKDILLERYNELEAEKNILQQQFNEEHDLTVELRSTNDALQKQLIEGGKLFEETRTQAYKQCKTLEFHRKIHNKLKNSYAQLEIDNSELAQEYESLAQQKDDLLKLIKEQENDVEEARKLSSAYYNAKANFDYQYARANRAEDEKNSLTAKYQELDQKYQKLLETSEKWYNENVRLTAEKKNLQQLLEDAKSSWRACWRACCNTECFYHADNQPEGKNG